MEIITQSSQDTQELGRKIGSNLKGGEILGLIGELGSGKTTFVQGLALGLGLTQNIISPTFILIRKYSATKRGFDFFHIDLYRLEEDIKAELVKLGVNDIWGKRENVVVIEWADKTKALLPPETILVNFSYKGNNRKIILPDSLLI